MVKRFTPLAAAIAILILLASCASFGPTSPNVSIISPEYESQADANFVEAQSILKDIASQNELLAWELGKLPEVQDGVDQDDLEALRLIRTVYQEHPKEFDAAFAEMYKVGKSEVRRYCSPLQAVYWLAEDGYLQYDDTVMEQYSLQRLLELAWSECKGLSAGNLLKIIHGYKDPEYKDAWLNDFPEVPVDEMREYVLGDYQLAPEKFTEDTRRYIKQLLNNKDIDTRWIGLTTVTERLNAPELIDFYTKEVIGYEMYLGDRKTDSDVLIVKQANCTDESQLIVRFLRKGGYQARILVVESSRRDSSGHVIVAFLDKGKHYIIDNGRPNESGIKGPYNSLSEIPYKTKRDQSILRVR